MRELTIGMETQAALNIIKERKDHCLKKKTTQTERGFYRSAILIMIRLKSFDFLYFTEGI